MKIVRVSDRDVNEFIKQHRPKEDGVDGVMKIVELRVGDSVNLSDKSAVYYGGTGVSVVYEQARGEGCFRAIPISAGHSNLTAAFTFFIPRSGYWLREHIFPDGNVIFWPSPEVGMGGYYEDN